MTVVAVCIVFVHCCNNVYAALLDSSLMLMKLESHLSPLLPLTCLLDNDPNVSRQGLLNAAQLIDTLSSEISEHLTCLRQVLIYNISDKIPTVKAAEAILQTCGIESKLRTCKRLRKLSPSACSPLLLEFNDESAVSHLLTNHRLLACHPLLTNSKVRPARSRMQRELFKISPNNN